MIRVEAERMIEANRKNSEDGKILMFDRIQMKVLGELLFGKDFDGFSVAEKGKKVCAELEEMGWKFDEAMTSLFELAVFKKV